MKLNLSCLSFAVVLSTLLLVKTTVAWQFNIPRLHTLQPADPTANATVRCKYCRNLSLTLSHHSATTEANLHLT